METRNLDRKAFLVLPTMVIVKYNNTVTNEG